MTDHAADGAAGEAPVRDERHGAGKSETAHHMRRGQHFAHTGSRHGSFVTDDNAVAGLQTALTGNDLVIEGYFAVIADGTTGMLQHFRNNAAGLDDAAVRRKIAAKNGKTAFFIVRIIKGMDHAGILDLGVLGHLIQSLAVNGAGAAVEVSGVDALTNDRGECSGTAEVLYGVRVVARIELDDLRRGTAGAAEVLQRQTVARLRGDCGQVECGIGGAAHHHIDAQRIFECFPRDDVAGLQILADHLHDTLTGPFRHIGTVVVVRGNGAVAHGRKTHDFREELHGDRRTHAAVAARAGTAGVVLHFVGDCIDAQRRGAHEIGKRFAVVIAVLGRSRGTAGDKDGRDVQAHDRHQHTGNDLVAVGNAHETVQRMSLNEGFHGIADNIAAGQRITHTRRIFRHAVAQGNCVGHRRGASRHQDALLYPVADPIEQRMTGEEVGVGTDDADQRLVDLFFGKSARLHQQSGKGTLGAVLHNVASHGVAPFRPWDDVLFIRVLCIVWLHRRKLRR